MATTLFKDTTYTVNSLVDAIGRGDIGLPDIQRPFVWQSTKVRDLLDSMYKGFPVGYLLFWETGAEGGTKQIGTGKKEKAPKLLIVDGQQRLTSLYAVISGEPIVKPDYSEGRIRIAFKPSDATFLVTDATVEKNPEYVPDISRVWEPGGYKNVVRSFLKRLNTKRPLSEEEEDALEDAIDRVRDLTHFPFKAVELDSTVDEEQVAEVFVRINSEGVSLNQADFILTLMSVFWEKGRKELEDFSRGCKTPTKGQASPFNWYIEPSPAQMLRVSVGLAFRRAVLKHVYTLLRGKDVDTGKADPDKREAQFLQLQQAQERILDLTNWHEFLLAIERAGYRGSKMISSDNTLLFTYVLWLLGRVDYHVPLDRLREIMARWFFMAHMTSRYSGSFETQFEQDVARLSDITIGDADGFIRTLSKIVDDTLTTDLWDITLPNDLATSAAKSPALLAYIAALNILDADALLSTGKVRARLDPAITTKKGIERHHIFPRAFLKNTLGVTDNKDINQIANMALVEWADNIDISDDAPAVYWPEQLAKKNLSDHVLEQQQYLHALPPGWQELDYQDFLAQRRVLMARVVRDAYQRLKDTGYLPEYPPAGTFIPSSRGSSRNEDEFGLDLTTSDLISLGVLEAGATLVGIIDDEKVEAVLLEDGSIEFDGEIYPSLSAAGKVAKGRVVNGWAFWRTQSEDGLKRLRRIRREYATGSFDPGESDGEPDED